MHDVIPVNELSVRAAKALLLTPQLQFLAGRAEFDGQLDTPFVDALPTDTRSRAAWQAILAKFFVKPLDVNTAESDKLALLLGVAPDVLDPLVAERPHFSLSEIVARWPVLRLPVTRAVGMVVVAPFDFPDKPRGRRVALEPSDEGVTLKYRTANHYPLLVGQLDRAGAVVLAHDQEQQVIAVRNSLPAHDWRDRLAKLKRLEYVVTTRPFLIATDVGVRAIYGDCIDVRIDGDGTADRWLALCADYGLVEATRYDQNARALRVHAQPHDMGAIFERMYALARNEIVHYVEPTALVLQ
jgi:hypothetical protein